MSRPRLPACLGTICLLAACPALAAAAPAPAAGAAQLVPAQSEIAFVSHQMGVPVSGTFSRFDAQVEFDPAHADQGHFVIGVELGSVVLPTADAMREVVKPGWFDAQHFPRAEFASRSVRAVKPGQYEVAGRLTIKGHGVDVTVPVQLERSGALTLASGTVGVKRLAFAIGDGEWSDTSLVADEVEIKFRLALAGLPAK
jgi:polyisoprenoid-binding protein YceI